MKRKANQLIISILLLISVFFGYQFLESSTYPEQLGNKQEKEIFRTVEIPDTLSFAGEKVPLQYFDVHEDLDRELLVNSYFHSQTLRYIKMAPRYFAMIEPILKEDSIPDDFKYLALAESGFDATVVSPAGAVGFWQFMKGTAHDYGLEVNNEVDERYNIEKSTHAACRYLHDSYDKYRSWTLVAATYNAGRNFVDKQIERQEETNYYNLLLGEETERYVFRILALKLVMENPEKYRFLVPKDELYSKWETKTVEVSEPVPNFAYFAKKHGTNYKILKMLNPWLRESYLTNKTGKTYEIKIPTEGFRTKIN